MTNRIKKRSISWTLTLLLGTAISGYIWSISAYSNNTANSTLNFSAIFVGGSCQISAPISIQFNNGNPLMSEDIKNGINGTKQSFNLILSKCAGWGLTPSILVTGATTTEFGMPLFRDLRNDTDANGYGILLMTEGTTDFNSNQNLANEGMISAKNWGETKKLETLSTSIPIKATLTCGTCDYADRHGGSFKATVTFDFLYE